MSNESRGFKRTSNARGKSLGLESLETRILLSITPPQFNAEQSRLTVFGSNVDDVVTCVRDCSRAFGPSISPLVATS